MVRARYCPFVAVTGFHNHNLLRRIVGLDGLERCVENTHWSVEIGVITQTNNVVVNIQLVELAVEIAQNCGLADTLTVYYYLCLRTNLATSLYGRAQK